MLVVVVAVVVVIMRKRKKIVETPRRILNRQCGSSSFVPVENACHEDGSLIFVIL